MSRELLASYHTASSVWSQSLAAGVLTLTGTKQSMCPTSGDGPNGSCMRYCGDRTSRPDWRRATDRFPDLPTTSRTSRLYMAEVIHRRSWPNRESVELATLEWVSWFNYHRLLGPIGYIPPAEADYRQLASQTSMVEA